MVAVRLDVLAAGQGTKILQIVVDGPAVPDNSIDPATIPPNTTYFYGFPNTNDTPRITLAPPVRER